jgi:hypothetical protein
LRNILHRLKLGVAVEMEAVNFGRLVGGLLADRRYA